MGTRLNTRLMGAEVEYFASATDTVEVYVNEYYSRMREVNTILLPASDVSVALYILKDIIKSIGKNVSAPLGTKGWYNGYGYAYNGVHLHLSGNIDPRVLEVNILKVIGKHGLSPRTVTSWHVLNRISKFSFKQRRKHRPVVKSNKNTYEIRILDIEYFLDDDIIEDIATAINGAYNGKVIEGDDRWASKLVSIPIENYKECCKFLDDNCSKFWKKHEDGVYVNTNTGDKLDFREFDEWRSGEYSQDNEEYFGEFDELDTEDDSRGRIDRIAESLRASVASRAYARGFATSRLEVQENDNEDA